MKDLQFQTLGQTDVLHKTQESQTLINNSLSNAFVITMISTLMINITKIKQISTLKQRKMLLINLQPNKKEEKMPEEKLKRNRLELLMRRKQLLRDQKMLKERQLVKETKEKEKEFKNQNLKKRKKMKRKKKRRKKRKKNKRQEKVGLMR